MSTPIPRHLDCDRRVAAWIGERVATAGPPSCTVGCARCCRQAVTATSAEALAILDAIERVDAHPSVCSRRTAGPTSSAAGSRLDALVAHAADVRAIARRAPTPLEARRRIGAIGPCPLLVDDRCSVYQSRPIPCRTLHVWHAPDRCGHDDPREEVPPELDAIRDDAIARSLRDEVLAGRWPFFGQLTVVTALVAEHREEYVAGADLRGAVPADVRRLGLVESLDTQDRAGLLDEPRSDVIDEH